MDWKIIKGSILGSLIISGKILLKTYYTALSGKLKAVKSYIITILIQLYKQNVEELLT